MADEIEIKLRVPPKALAAVEKLGWLKSMYCGPVKREKLRSVYFDTPKHKLLESGMVLRVRHIGRKRVQTMKAEGDGVFARKEWECPIAADTPDLGKLDGAPPVKGKLQRKLAPVFETIVTRTAMPVRSGDSELEVAIDRGEIKCARRREAISEIEIELKNGNPDDVARLAERIAEAVPATYEVKTKPERGYALLDKTANGAVRARDVPLEPKANCATAFRAIGMECLRHLAANEAAVRAADTDGVHQMRVGLRRLRAAISLFKDMLQDPETENLKTEFKWLTEQLGPARDFDVFVRESVEPLGETASEIDVLRKDMEQKRDDGFERARTAVDGDRYRKLVLRTALWLANGIWSTLDDDLQKARRERPAAAFASEILTARTAKIIKKSRKLAKLDPQRRHRLRIAIKKLRYATEFFAALFESAKARARQQKLAGTLEELQDALGRLNDISVHKKLAGDIVKRGKHKDRRPEKAYAMGIVAGREQAQFEACIAVARKAGGRLATRRVFWT